MPEILGNPDAFDVRQASHYLRYRQNTSYAYDPGVFVMAVASRTPKTVVARVHGGYGVRKVDVDAAKRGSPPILPAANDTDRDTLIGCVINIPLPAISSSSPEYDWVASGSYLFVTTHEDGPRVPGKDYLPAGQYPFPTPYQDRAIEAIYASGDSVQTVGDALPGQIPSGNYVWPYAIMPPAFFNPILLRDLDSEATE
jgi:hypothetical protein